ncbi:MAG: DUF6982 domain-containing protein [Acidobacteriota bacterium]
MSNRVVARFPDGRVLKGSVSNFSPMRDRFMMLTQQQKVLEIKTSQLKALFFVKSLVGNPAYNERKSFDISANPLPKVVCEFHDGEVLVGHSAGYDPERLGFFLTPVDPKSNNDKVYVVNRSTRRVFMPN